MKTEAENVQEILQRVTRTESRIVQLGDHVGANLRIKQRVDVTWGANPHVTVDAMDVSLSRIVSELEHHGVSAPAVPVFLDGRIVATVYPKGL